jgi:hypothetical protein
MRFILIVNPKVTVKYIRFGKYSAQGGISPFPGSPPMSQTLFNSSLHSLPLLNRGKARIGNSTEFG